jgi:class 3 adenylate cyclase
MRIGLDQMVSRSMKKIHIVESQPVEKEVTLLFTDMVGFGQTTAGMKPREMADFLIAYRRKLESVILDHEKGAQHVDHIAGDAATCLFEAKPSEEDGRRSVRAFGAAIKLLQEIALKRVAHTHIGIYSGRIIELQYDNQIVRFGNSYTAASRLQDLCGHFGTSILMDRNVAMVQGGDLKYISSVGKITPKGFNHPIHIFTVDKPGIHRCPLDVDEEKLLQYVKIKNEAIEYFCGNEKRGIKPDFPRAREKLYRAETLFRETTGRKDIATERVLGYIGEHNQPTSDFISTGMKLDTKSGDTPLGVQLFRLSQELLKSLDREFYDTFVLNTEWEQSFRLEWREKEEVIIERGSRPDGVYFLTNGKVRVVDSAGRVIAVVNEGDVFGEMAYFSSENVRNATVIADSDLVLHRISGEDFVKFPAIRNLFERIAQKRLVQKQKALLDSP